MRSCSLNIASEQAVLAEIERSQNDFCGTSDAPETSQPSTTLMTRHMHALITATYGEPGRCCWVHMSPELPVVSKPFLLLVLALRRAAYFSPLRPVKVQCEAGICGIAFRYGGTLISVINRRNSAIFLEFSPARPQQVFSRVCGPFILTLKAASTWQECSMQRLASFAQQ